MSNESAIGNWLDKSDENIEIVEKRADPEELKSLDTAIDQYLIKAQELLNKRYKECSTKEVYDKIVCLKMCLN